MLYMVGTINVQSIISNLPKELHQNKEGNSENDTTIFTCLNMGCVPAPAEESLIYTYLNMCVPHSYVTMPLQQPPFVPLLLDLRKW
jgi:hypothetical protein